WTLASSAVCASSWQLAQTAFGTGAVCGVCVIPTWQSSQESAPWALVLRLSASTNRLASRSERSLRSPWQARQSSSESAAWEDAAMSSSAASALLQAQVLKHLWVGFVYGEEGVARIAVLGYR